MLLYALLHLTGYDLPLDELKRFRQWGSLTPGHPEHGHTPGVEATTGPLGQGTGNAVGMAMAGKHLAARFGEPAGFRVFALVSDGDLMEGVSGEASSLAGHLELDNLVFLYDDNHVTIDGDTQLAFTEDRVARYAAFGWHTLTVEDGNDLDAIDAAIAEGIAHEGQPTFIAVKTIIGYGSVDAGTSRAHSDARGPEQQAQTKRTLGFDPDKFFFIPDAVLERYREALDVGAAQQAEWKAAVGPLPDPAIPNLVIEPFGGDEKPMATRAASGKVIAQVVSQVPQMVGGSADLTPSNNTRPEGWEDFEPGAYAGRYLRFGVREHGMSADRERPRRRRPAAVRRDLLQLPRLREAGGAPLGARAAARHLGVHPRLGRARRGRPDPPADRAARHPAGDARRVRLPSRRCERDDRGLADRAGARPADGARPDPPGAPGARS